MSKKGSKKKKVKPTKERGLLHFLTTPQFAVARGAFYMLLAVYTVVAIVSYIAGFAVAGREPASSSNWCGTFGGWLASLLVSGSFGIA